jgi:hypothetical protein
LPYAVGEAFGMETRLVKYKNNNAVYLRINGRELRHVKDPETFNTCHFDWNKIIPEVNKLPAVATIDLNTYLYSSKNECQTFKTPSKFLGEMDYYVVLGNTVRRFGTVDDLTNVMTTNITTIQNLTAMPKLDIGHGPVLSGTSLEKAADGKIYLVTSSEKQLIAAPETFERCGFNLEKVADMQNSTTSLPTLPNNIDIYAYW